ncbi:MAG: hypothetical protein JXA20_03930 [Spirochaetes bacterium]|nr:hypothetical protein [Spirochaetota bacterium]
MVRRLLQSGALAAAAVLLPLMLPASASDLSDATSLREKCEKEVKVVEIAVKNFGSAAVLTDFQKGNEILRGAKIMMAQSKFAEAKRQYNDYLTLQNGMYKNLSAIYIERTDAINKEVPADLVDFIDNEKVCAYFKLANQNLVDARTSITRQYYKHAVDLCRDAKRYALGSYKLAGKALPSKYGKDMADINGKISD